MSRCAVLIVDHDEDHRRMCRDVLEHAGHTAWESEGGDQVLEAAVALRPGAILLEVMLPGGAGWRTIERLKADPRTAAIPVVALTPQDLGSRRERQRLEEAGF